MKTLLSFMYGCPTSKAKGSWGETSLWNSAKRIGPGAMRVYGGYFDSGLEPIEANTSYLDAMTIPYTFTEQ